MTVALILVLMTLPFWWWLGLKILIHTNWRLVLKIFLGLVALLVCVALIRLSCQTQQAVQPPPEDRIEVVSPQGQVGTIPRRYWAAASADGYRLVTPPAATASATPKLLPQEQPSCDDACLRRLEEEHKKLR